MPDTDSLGTWLRRFLGEHLPTERNPARNTQLSYRDTFCLLLPFFAAQARCTVDRAGPGSRLGSRARLLGPFGREPGLLPADPQPASNV